MKALSPLLGLLVVCSVLAGAAQPPMQPMIVKGQLTVDDEPALIGTYVIAKLGDNELARAMVKQEGFYALTIPGNDSFESSEIRIFVNAVDSGKTVTWSAGGIITLDLNIGSLDEPQNGSDDSASGPSGNSDSGSNTLDGSNSNAVNTAITPDANPSAGADVQGPPAGDDIEDANASIDPQANPQESGSPGDITTAKTPIGDNSILFIVFAVIIILLIGLFFAYKKHSGGTK